jgi:hypothetical protein
VIAVLPPQQSLGRALYVRLDEVHARQLQLPASLSMVVTGIASFLSAGLAASTKLLPTPVLVDGFSLTAAALSRVTVAAPATTI